MKARAFSLIEMMVVVAIIAIVATFAVPAVGSVVNNSRLTQAASLLSNQLSYARQYAMTRNRSIEVRFIRFQDPEAVPSDGSTTGSTQFHAIQLLEVQDGGATISIGKIEFLPDATVLCADARSSLLNGETASQIAKVPAPGVDAPLPRGVEMHYDYVSFRYLPDGSTNLAANHNWFVTAVAAKDQLRSTKLPANFFILQIDPVNGITRPFRPGLG